MHSTPSSSQFWTSVRCPSSLRHSSETTPIVEVLGRLDGLCALVLLVVVLGIFETLDFFRIFLDPLVTTFGRASHENVLFCDCIIAGVPVRREDTAEVENVESVVLSDASECCHQRHALQVNVLDRLCPDFLFVIKKRFQRRGNDTATCAVASPELPHLITEKVFKDIRKGVWMVVIQESYFLMAKLDHLPVDGHELVSLS